MNERNEVGIAALNDGRNEEAATIFRELADLHRTQPGTAALLRYNLSSALINLGRLEEARQNLERVEKTPGLPYAAQTRLLSAISLVKVYVLQGKLAVAERWADDARRRLGRQTINRAFMAADLALAEAMLRCRQGDEGRAAALLEDESRMQESALSVTAMRRVWLLRAFIAGRTSSARDQGEVEQWLSKLRPYREGEFANWSGSWPELRAFLDSYGLS